LSTSDIDLADDVADAATTRPRLARGGIGLTVAFLTGLLAGGIGLSVLPTLATPAIPPAAPTDVAPPKAAAPAASTPVPAATPAKAEPRSTAASGPSATADFTALAARVGPAVVNIATVEKLAEETTAKFEKGSPLERFNDLFGEEREASSLGSGFIIDPAGTIVTNNHVVASASAVEVILTDGTRLPAEIIGRDPATDLAVLKVSPASPLPAVRFGDSGAVKIGEWVMAIGNPFGLGGSVSVGVVSARNRRLGAGAFDDFIQTDAAINRGNSGGPLFNARGEVIGVNTAILSPSGQSVGVGFATPADMVDAVVEQIVASGAPARGSLGMRVKPLDRDGAALEAPSGAFVTRVLPGGPADRAGLKPGDVITGIDGQTIADPQALARAIAFTAPGKTLALDVRRRDGSTAALEAGVVPATDILREAGDAAEDALRRPISAPLGLRLGPLTDDFQTQYAIPRDLKDGAAVMAIRAGSPAARVLEPGDVIRAVGLRRTPTSGSVETALAAAQGRGAATIIVEVQRGTLRTWRMLKLK
jgi:serine protease Do